MRRHTRLTTTAVAVAAAALALTACSGEPTEHAEDAVEAPVEQPADETPVEDEGPAEDETPEDDPAVDEPVEDEVPEDEPVADEPSTDEAAEDNIVPGAPAPDADTWIGSDELGQSEVDGPPGDAWYHELLPALNHPPGAGLFDTVETAPDSASDMVAQTALAVEELLDAREVYDIYEQQLFDQGWEYDERLQTEPLRNSQDDVVSWRATFQDPDPDGWYLQVVVIQNPAEGGNTIILLRVQERRFYQ